MDKTTQDLLVELAYKLIALATGGTPATETPAVVAKTETPVAPAYPREETVNGIRYMLKAPLNANYAGGMAATIFSKGHVLFDPSNAPEGYPLRSPANYPLSYAIGGDGKPVGAARVLFNGNTFADDAAVALYIERTTRTPAQEAQIVADWAEVNKKVADRVAQETAKTETPAAPEEGGVIDMGG